MRGRGGMGETIFPEKKGGNPSPLLTSIGRGGERGGEMH